MIKIEKLTNGFKVEGIDNVLYPDNGTLVFGANTVILVTDESNMATFRSASNFDVLFSGLIENITIDGQSVTKENIVEKFQAVANVSAGSSSSTSLKIKLVDELPASGEQGTIYLIANNKGSYTEYLWLEETSKWEELGDVTKIDLSTYETIENHNADKALLEASIALKVDQETFDTKEEVISKALNDLHESIPTVPTNVSAFTNDAGYLTQHQSLDNYYTKQEIDTKEQNINESITLKANSADLATVATSGSYNDLNDKLTAGENITIENNVISSTGGTQIQADWNQTNVEAVDYIKNKPTFPDTSEFVTKTEYNPKEKAIAEALTNLNENKADKTNYYTKQEIDNKFSEVETTLSQI